MKSYIRDKSVWKTPNLCSDGFAFEIQVLSYAPYDTERVKESVRAQGLSFGKMDFGR